MVMKTLRLSVLAAGLLTFAFAAPAVAQSTATLQGTVTDAQGAVVPGAQVTATNEDTAARRSVLTDAAGYYQMAALPAGSYQLETRRSSRRPAGLVMAGL